MSTTAERKDALLGQWKLLVPLAPPPEAPADGSGERRFEISVVFTSLEATAESMRIASGLAKGLNAHISLIATQVVPYPLPLDHPQVSREFCERGLRELANESPVDTTVSLYLCRDRLATLGTVLKRDAIVIIGGRRKWWPTREKRLAGEIRRSGHEVIFAEMTRGSCARPVRPQSRLVGSRTSPS
jgi:hypothetical protein